MTGKYLITTDSYFLAPDGKNYKAVWGEVEIMEDSVLGVKTNRNASNWYAKIGSDEKHVIVAGCQIHYAVRCEQVPYTGMSEDWVLDATGVKISETPTKIYVAENLTD